MVGFLQKLRELVPGCPALLHPAMNDCSRHAFDADSPRRPVDCRCVGQGFRAGEKIRASGCKDKSRGFIPKAAMRWWRLFLVEHYPKRKPGRSAKEPDLDLVQN
jgi:hypothetical protein